MVPLRLDLPEETALRVNQASQTTKDIIEKEHQTLLAQVQRFYAQKLQELELFTKRTLDKNSDEISAASLTPVEEPKLKPIVKRQPSLAEKRVSFSSSPPKVELFKMPMETDDEDSLSSQSPGSSNLDRLRDLELAQSKDDLDPEEGKKPAIPFLSVSSSAPRVAEDMEQREGDMFSFEDVIATGNDKNKEDDLATSHHAKFTFAQTEASKEFESKPSSSGSSVPQAHHWQETKRKYDLGDTEIVGSAPLAIRPPSRGTDGDGGPRPRTKAELRDEEMVPEGDAGIGSYIPRNQLKSMDPQSMSFSERMEWEELRKRG